MTHTTSSRRHSIGFALTLALSAPVQAINLAPNGKGEVLIFPYYTVSNGFDTLISVTNTSDRTVLANLRLREAKNGRPVREFHLALSPHDVWTGAVTTDGSGGALIRSFDATCTAPALQSPGPERLDADRADVGQLQPSQSHDNGGTRARSRAGRFHRGDRDGRSRPCPSRRFRPRVRRSKPPPSMSAGTPRSCATVQNLPVSARLRLAERRHRRSPARLSRASKRRRTCCSAVRR